MRNNVTESGCDHEPAAISAVTSGQWTTQLRAHVESCINCRDAVSLSRSLQTLDAAAQPDLPPAAYVWWQSRMRERKAAQRRVTRFIAIAQAATFTVSITGLMVWMIRHSQDAGAAIKSLSSSFAIWTSSGLASSVAGLVWLSFVLLLINVLLTLRAVVTNHKS